MGNSDILDSFSLFLQQEEKSKATREKYLRDVRSLFTFLGQQSLDKEKVLAWKESLIARGYAVRSVNSMLASVNCLLEHLGYPEYKVKTLRLQRQTYCAQERELTKAEYLRLLSASKRDERLNLLIQTICATGIRVSELRHFTIEAVRSGTISIACKGKNRVILVPEKLRKKLIAYAEKRKIASGAIFVTRSGRTLDRSNIWAAMKRLCKAAEVAASKVFPHNLRKLFARTFYGVEKDIAKLADILGHSSINTTRIYIMETAIEHREKLERLGLVI